MAARMKTLANQSSALLSVRREALFPTPLLLRQVLPLPSSESECPCLVSDRTHRREVTFTSSGPATSIQIIKKSYTFASHKNPTLIISRNNFYFQNSTHTQLNAKANTEPVIITRSARGTSEKR